MIEVAQGHTMKKYDAELSKLEKRVLSMGELVHQQLLGISVALLQDGAEQAMEGSESEKTLDARELNADHIIIQVIARPAPMGRDPPCLRPVSLLAAGLVSMGE